MPKPAQELLEAARYPFCCSIEPRFGDLDINLHINNVALTGILEDGRVRFHRASGYHSAIAAMASMVASLSIEYLGQSYYPDPLSIHVGIFRLGRTSYVLDQLVIQREVPVAFAQAVMVCVSKDGAPAEIPQAFRDTVERWMLRT